MRRKTDRSSIRHRAIWERQDVERRDLPIIEKHIVRLLLSTSPYICAGSWKSNLPSYSTFWCNGALRRMRPTLHIFRVLAAEILMGASCTILHRTPVRTRVKQHLTMISSECLALWKYQLLSTITSGHKVCTFEFPFLIVVIVH